MRATASLLPPHDAAILLSVTRPAQAHPAKAMRDQPRWIAITPQTLFDTPSTVEQTALAMKAEWYLIPKRYFRNEALDTQFDQYMAKCAQDYNRLLSEGATLTVSVMEVDIPHPTITSHPTRRPSLTSLVIAHRYFIPNHAHTDESLTNDFSQISVSVGPQTKAHPCSTKMRAPRAATFSFSID